MIYVNTFLLTIINVLFIHNLIVSVICEWNLENFGIGDNYFASSIAIFNTRTFLALPRSVPCNDKTSPTLVEVNWNSDSILPTTSFLNGKNKITGVQKWGLCKDIQDAISLNVEVRKLKLWILDKGNDQCGPKLVSFNLFYNDIADTVDLEDVPRNGLNCLEIDQKSIDHGSRAFIGDAGDNCIIVISLKDLHWSKLKLTHMNNQLSSIRTDYLAISKMNSVLFITGKTDLKVYSLDLDHISDKSKPVRSEEERTTIAVNVTLIGEKLGTSSALETDYKSGLSYFMVNYDAIVRWTIGLPMIAENHNVLGQSSERLPYVSQLFTGPYNGLWALVNPLNEEQCFEYQNDLNRTNIIKLEHRVVQILRYNKLVK